MENSFFHKKKKKATGRLDWYVLLHFSSSLVLSLGGRAHIVIASCSKIECCRFHFTLYGLT